MVGFFVCLFWFDFYSHRTKEKSSCSFKSHQRAGYCHGYNHQTWGNMVRRGWPILPGVKPFGNSVVSQCHRASCAWHCFTRKTKLSPRQLWGCQPWHSLQSWVAAHCWHVQFWALGGKKNPHRNVEPGKDSRCPSYISCSGTFWKLLKKREYSKFAHSHLRCFHWNPSSFPSWTVTARPEPIQ